MAPLVKLALTSITILSVSAFSLAASGQQHRTLGTARQPSGTNSRYHSTSRAQKLMSNINDSGLRHRGGSSSAMAATPDAVPSSPPPPPPKSKRVRIQAFDSMRFFLITSIVLGHFIKFADPSDFLFKFFSQHNVVVGAFFALSGYVTAYTSTENGQLAASPKLTETPSQKWTLSRVFGWYPLHLLTLILFSPMFIYADNYYNGWIKTAWHGFMSVTLTQAWFPLHAEVWNAPTWYLSGLAFATALMPFGLPKIAKMDKKALRKTAIWLTIINILPKIGYVYGLGTLTMPEGWTSPKAHPNLALFNVQRFSPVMIASEVLLGAVACRLVMLDGASKDEAEPVKTNALSTLFPLVAIISAMAVRAAGIVDVTDMLFRPLFFIPVFLRMLMSCHRNTVRTEVKDPTVSVLSTKFLVWLGNLSFPIFIVHGPLGQVFYKKLIANKLFGQVLNGPGYFGVYLASVFALAWILQKTFLENKAVGAWSKKAVDSLSSWM